MKNSQSKCLTQFHMEATTMAAVYWEKGFLFCLIIIPLICSVSSTVDSDQSKTQSHGQSNDAKEEFVQSDQEADQFEQKLVEEFSTSRDPEEVKESYDDGKETASEEKADQRLEVNRQNSKLDITGTEEVNQSIFSIGNILKSIVDPVLEEFEKSPGKIENITQELVNKTLESNETLQNETLADISNVNKTEKKVRFQCSGKNLTDANSTYINSTVKIVNNTGLLNLLNFDKNESDCVLVLFYAPWCPFCAQMAPNYNALARAFPQLEVLAVDAAQFSNLNARFGTVLVPNILLFHQSRAVVRFNQTDKSFESLVIFVKNTTGLEPNITVNVTDEDNIGPLLSVPTEEFDYLLGISWVFVIVFTSIVFIKSSCGQQWINKVRLLWQEHQHID